MTQYILHESTEGTTRVYGKNICRDTVIPEKGILIVAPEHQAGLSAAKLIMEKFNSMGMKGRILKNPSRDILVSSEQPVVVLGNLSNSKCVEYMYYKYLCMTDLSYPGEEGYNIRTLIDPFATSHNVVHIGYSDDVGLEKGIQAFVNKICNPLPYINEVWYKKLLFTEKYMQEISRAKVPHMLDLVPSIHTSFWRFTGLLSYVTGDLKHLETYLDGWRKMVEISKENPYLVKGTHLFMANQIEIWRLLEFSGMIPDDIRLLIEKCILDWAQSREGVEYARDLSKQKDLPSHNHTMFCALSLTYIHDYFIKRYPELSFVKEWKEIADNVFYTFNNKGWKPYCDDSHYSNQVTLHLVFSYSIFEEEHRFLNTSAKEVAKWLKAIMGQNGMVPSYGDGSVKSPYPAFVSSVLAHYTKDGEMKWLFERFKELNPELRGMDHERDFRLQRQFDSGVVSRVPDTSVVSRILLDQYTYDVWQKNPGVAKRFNTTPPAGSYEDCFDKVSIRTGWDELRDDFFLIDGLGSNGVHAYSDAMGVLDYTSKGIVWLVEENNYRWPEPENCTVVTVAKDGYASDVPGYTLMEEQKSLDENRYYLRMRLKDYNGTDWVREVYLIKGIGTVFHDTVICNQEGEFVINVHWRTPSKVKLSGNTVKAVRTNREGSTYEFRLSGYGSHDISMAVEEIPYGTRLFDHGGMYDKDAANTGADPANANTMWESRYHDKDVAVSVITSKSSSFMRKGDTLSFTHIVHPAKEGEELLIPKMEGNTLTLSISGKVHSLPVTHTGKASPKEKVPAKVVESVKFKEEFSLNKKIKSVVVTQDNCLACALEGGKVAWICKGKVIWEASLQGEIHVMEYIKPERLLVIGHGHNKLSAVDHQGQPVWDTQSKRIPTMLDSWELAHPQIISIRYVETKKGSFILTGAGDNQIRVYNTKGEYIRYFNIRATVPDMIDWVDIDLDGEPEVIAAGKVDSAYGMFYVNTIDGVSKKDLRTGFWLNTIQSYHFAFKDQKLILVIGMKYQENFKVLCIEQDSVKTHMEKRLGGIVKSVEMNEDFTEFYAGTSKGSVMAFDTKGKEKWNVYVEDNVKELYRKQDHTIVLCESGKVSVISNEGKLIAQGNLPQNVDYCVSVQGEILLVCGDTVYSIIY